MEHLPDDLLTLEELAKLLKVRPRTIEVWERAGDFPPGFLLSPREKRWTWADYWWFIESKRRRLSTGQPVVKPEK